MKSLLAPAKFTRRRFWSLAAGGFTAVVLSRNAWSASDGIPAGIQLHTVKDDFEKDPADTLRRLAQIGYSEVETGGFGRLTASQFRNLVRDAGLRVPSAHLAFGMEATSKMLDDIKTLGAEYAVSSVLAPRPLDPSEGIQSFLKLLNSMTANDFKHTAAKANDIAQKAQAAGLQYAYHNHPFEFRDLGGGQTGYDILLRETDPSIVKFELDCGWMKVAGVDPVAYLTRHPGRFVMLHIKDFDTNNKPIVEAGLKAGIKHIFVEQEPPFKEMTPMEVAAADYAALHSLLAHH